MTNLFRTGLLLAGRAVLFMAVGYLIGGSAGMIVALVVVAASNLLAYWNDDRMVLFARWGTADRGAAGADGDLAHARIRRRPRRC